MSPSTRVSVQRSRGLNPSTVTPDECREAFFLLTGYFLNICISGYNETPQKTYYNATKSMLDNANPAKYKCQNVDNNALANVISHMGESGLGNFALSDLARAINSAAELANEKRPELLEDIGKVQRGMRLDGLFFGRAI